jgi:hypothetical protein
VHEKSPPWLLALSSVEGRLALCLPLVCTNPATEEPECFDVSVFLAAPASGAGMVSLSNVVA